MITMLYHSSVPPKVGCGVAVHSPLLARYHHNIKNHAQELSLIHGYLLLILQMRELYFVRLFVMLSGFAKPILMSFDME